MTEGRAHGSKKGADPRRPSQERDRVAAGAVLGVTAACVVVTLGSIAWASWAARGGGGRALPEGVEVETPSRISGVFQTLIPDEPVGDAASATRARLDRFGWVDREAGEIRIPIAVAIELQLAHTGPGPDEPAGAATAEPGS
ncbi:MAG: hypothetical protein R3F35_17800 [Myxococcota bacterium]